MCVAFDILLSTSISLNPICSLHKNAESKFSVSKDEKSEAQGSQVACYVLSSW